LEEVARREDPNRHREGPLTVLSMTRLVPGKNVDLVIRALTHLDPDARLVVAGDGPERQPLTALAWELGVQERVTFAGWVAGEQKTRLLETADVYCLPSTEDSFGLGFVEAMAHGMPVVATRYGAVPDVVPHEHAGFLVDAPNPVAIAAAVQRLRPAARRTEIGAAARAWVLEAFSVASVGQRICVAVARFQSPSAASQAP
jgi:glycosyltransferase involved in cell wall biosynthesis